MVAKTHNAIALASLVSLSAFYPPNNLSLTTFVGVLIGNNIGALIPDMDSGGNYLWGLLPQGKFLGRFLRRIFYKHRTITHSLLGTFLVYKLLDFILHKILDEGFVNVDIIIWSIMIGFVSHLLSDALTEEGIPLLYPLNFNFGFPPIKKWRIKTGRWFESFVIFPGVWVYLIFFIQRYYSVIVGILKNIK